MTEQEMIDRIAEIEHLVRELNYEKMDLQVRLRSEFPADYTEFYKLLGIDPSEDAE